MRPLLVALGIVVLGLAGTLAALASPRPYVRYLQSADGHEFCSAVVLRPGLVLTAHHCAEAGPMLIQPKGTPGTVVADGDDKLDLALLVYPASEAPCPCVRFAGRDADLDESVYIVGFPHRMRIRTEGRAQGNADTTYGNRLVTTALVDPGNSGGGVFVRRGSRFLLAGILVEGANHFSYAVTVTDIRTFLATADNI